MKRVEIRACRFGILIMSICILVELLQPSEWGARRVLILIGAGLMLFLNIYAIRRLKTPISNDAETGRPGGKSTS